MKQVLVAVLFIIFGSNLKAQNADIELLKEINLGRNKQLDPLWSGLSYSVTPLVCITPVALYLYPKYKNDSVQHQKNKYLIGGIIVAGLVSTSLKYAINRPRPYVTYPYLEKNTESTSPSFPSGHTSAAFSVATSVSMAYPKWYIIAPAYAWAGGVAYSRMTLAAHYPSDVLAGAIIGTGSVWLSVKLNRWINHKSK